MLIDGTKADRAPAGQRHARLAAAGEQRPQGQDRRAHGLDELVGREGPVDSAGIEGNGSGRDRVQRDAHLRQQRLHRPHVLEARHVREHERLRREQRRAEDRQRRILRAGDPDFADQRPAALDQQLVHLSARPAARRALRAPPGGSERSERGGRSSVRPAAQRALRTPAGGSEHSERGGSSSQVVRVAAHCAGVSVVIDSAWISSRIRSPSAT
jgi:hypothetical protein